MIEHWGVDVRINCERVLSVESDSIGGRDLSTEEHKAAVEAAKSLLSFLGNECTCKYDVQEMDLWVFCPRCGGNV